MKKWLLLMIISLSLSANTVEKQQNMIKNLVSKNKEMMAGQNYKKLLNKSKVITDTQKKIMNDKKMVEIKKKKIMLKIIDYIEESIRKKDIEQIRKFNILNKCLIYSNSFKDMDGCKEKFKNL